MKAIERHNRDFAERLRALLKEDEVSILSGGVFSNDKSRAARLSKTKIKN